MKETDRRFDSRQAFAWKAAWFSLLAPLGTVLIALALFYFSNHSGPNPPPDFIGKLVTELVLGGALIIQVASLIMGVAGGLIAKSGLAQGKAVIGLLLSLGLGFVTLILLSIAIWGFWSGC